MSEDQDQDQDQELIAAPTKPTDIDLDSGERVSSTTTPVPTTPRVIDWDSVKKAYIEMPASMTMRRFAEEQKVSIDRLYAHINSDGWKALRAEHQLKLNDKLEERNSVAVNERKAVESKARDRSVMTAQMGILRIMEHFSDKSVRLQPNKIKDLSVALKELYRTAVLAAGGDPDNGCAKDDAENTRIGNVSDSNILALVQNLNMNVMPVEKPPVQRVIDVDITKPEEKPLTGS